MDYGLAFWPKVMALQLKCLTDGFVSYKHATFHITRHHCQLFGLSF